MNNTPHVYSKRKILEALVASAVVAAILLVTVILPAEYGIDPTGLGGLAGLTALSRQEPQVEPNTGHATHPETYRTSEERIVIPALGELEYKFKLTLSDLLVYSWESDAPLYFDLHGEPTEEEGKQYLPFQSFGEGTDNLENGFLLPPFTGTHGWYWRNDSTQPVTVVLKTAGYYEVLGARTPSTAVPR
jgi:hypothetical protein